MLSRRRGIEVAPPRLKFHLDNTTNKKKKKNKKKIGIHVESHDGIHVEIPTLLFQQKKQSLLLLLLFTIKKKIMCYTRRSRVEKYGLYLVSDTNKKLCYFNCQLLTHHDDDDNHTDDFPPYLLQHNYNNGFIYYYYQSRRITNSGTLLTYGLCIPNSRLVLAVLVFVNAAAGSKVFKSITPPHGYLVEPNNTITSSSIGLIDCVPSDTTSSRPPPPVPVNDNWFIFEVLTRLPVKTLLRFKSVCKRWCFLIQNDQNFIDLHLLYRSRLRRLFILNPVPWPSPPETPPSPPKINQEECDQSNEIFLIDTDHDNESYITADLILFQQHNNNNNTNKGEGVDTTNVVVVVVADTVREVDSTSYDYVSNPINGLICLIDSRVKYVVRICNICTGELSPWFESSLACQEKHCSKMDNYLDARPNYQFGFDPSTNEHKLVCLWKVIPTDRGDRRSLICEVLTVGRQGINGNNRWRRIEEVPHIPYRPHDDSVHVNGVIYWNSILLHNGFWDSKHGPVCILAFDLGTEKFKTITVSDFILNQPRDDIGDQLNPLTSPSYDIDFGGCVKLLEVGGHLAMLVRITNCLFKMYIYEDDDYKLEEEVNRMPIDNGGSYPSNSVGRWSEVTSIKLPFHLGESCGVRFCKFVGSDDEIILTSSEGPNCGKEAEKKKCVSFYSYNWKKGCWREFEVRGSSVSVPHLCTECFVATFSESLLRVNNDKALS